MIIQEENLQEYNMFREMYPKEKIRYISMKITFANWVGNWLNHGEVISSRRCFVNFAILRFLRTCFNVTQKTHFFYKFFLITPVPIRIRETP